MGKGRKTRSAKNTTGSAPARPCTPAECPVCLDRYEAEGDRAPLVYTCGHSICQECSKGLLDAATGQWMCPMRCDELTRTAPRPNFALRDNMEALATMSPPRSGPPECDECVKEDACLYCKQCNAAFYAPCSERIHKIKVMKKHQICPLGEESRSLTCAEHDEPLKYMCLDCQEIVCTDCKEFGDHKGHEHDLVKNVACTQREQLKEALGGIEQFDTDATNTARNVEAVLQEIGPAATATAGCCDGQATTENTTVAVAADKIKVHFSELRVALVDREVALLDELEAARAQKLDKLDEQQAALGLQRSLIHTTKYQLETAIQVLHQTLVSFI